MKSTPLVKDLDAVFESLWGELGVSRSQTRCPRRCGQHLVVDWALQQFACHECKYSGQGVADLARLRPRLRDPFRETDSLDPDVCGGSCPAPFHQLLTNGSIFRLIPRPCKSRTCSHCGPQRRQQWIALLGPKLEAQQVYSATGTTEQWSAVYKSIYRGGGEFLRIPTRTGWIVFTTTKVARSTEVPMESIRLCVDLALSQCDPLGHRSASKAWRESTLAEEESESLHDLLEGVFGTRSAWWALRYRKLSTVLAASVRFGANVPATPDQVLRRLEWQRPSDPITDSEYLHQAGITDPSTPPYSNLDQWLVAA